MSNSININENNNSVNLEDQNRSIAVTDNNTGITTNVTQDVTNVVNVGAVGPPGPQGPQGIQGPSGSVADLPEGVVSSSIQINVLGFVTSSATASFVLNSQTASMNVATSSYAFSASLAEEASNNFDLIAYNNTTFNIIAIRTNGGQQSATITNVPSASHAYTSSTAGNLFGTPSIIVNHITASGDISSSGMIKSFTGSFGRLEGLSPITVGNSVIFEQPVTGSIFSGSFIGDGSGLINVTSPGTLSGSAQIASEISGAFGASSASFSTRISANEAVTAKTLISGSSQIASSISGSFGAPSASFSIRISANESALLTLNTSGLISSSAQIASDISGSFTAPSASFSSRVTTNETNISDNRSLITGITSSLSTTGRMVFVGANGILTSEAGFEYDAAANQLSVDSLNVNHLTSSFITSSRIYTSGSNIFGDDSSDTQTLVGTTIITGSAQITGSLTVSGIITGNGSGLTNIPASGIVGLNLSQIADGSATASISETNGFQVNTDTQITGSLLISGSKIHLRGESRLPGPILELESIGGSSGKDVYVKVGDASENYAYAFGADDSGNSFRIAYGVYDSVALGVNDRFIIDDTGNIEIPVGDISGSATSTASFGTYLGNGSGLTNIPASGITGLNLSRIASGSVTASISPNKGFQVNTDTQITGSLLISGSSTPLLSLPDAPKAAMVISGSNDGTRLRIYDTKDNSSPVYTEGAGIVLTGGEGSAQAILEMSAVGSNNGGSNNEQTFIRSSEMLTITGNSAAAGDNIKLLGSSNYGLKLDASTSAVSLQFITNGGSTVSTLELGNGTYTKANASGTYYKIGRSSTDWLTLSSTQATFNRHVSSSVISTASFGTYVGDGSQLSGISTTPFPFSGSAIITGSLTVSQSIVDFTSASAVLLNIEDIPLVNPIVEYFDAGTVTGSGTTITLPNSLSYVSSSVYEYLEVFVNGLRLRYNRDFIPTSNTSIQYQISIPSGSEVTYKSLKRP